MKRKDVLLIGILLLIALVSYVGLQKWQGGRTAVVTKPAAESSTEKEEAASETEAVTEMVTEAATEGTTQETIEGTTIEEQEAESVEVVSAEAESAEMESSPAKGDTQASENPDAARFGIRIYAQGEEMGVYSLADDQVIEIGGTNTVEIKDGGATMIDAQCPDQLCRYMGTITDAYGLIVCLPNGVIVEGVNLAPQPEEVEIDGIS